MHPDNRLPTRSNAPVEVHAYDVSQNMKTDSYERNYRRKIIRNEFASLAIMIILGITIGLLLSRYVFRPYRVVGESMSQTLHTGDRLVVNRLGKTVASISGEPYIPKRYEIIVFKSPFVDELLVKRVIGLPGERVVVKNGKITIYNEEFPTGFNVDEGTDYEDNLPAYTTGEIDIEVTEDHVFVSGDNRTPNGSSDSRNEIGLVSAEQIVGNVSLRLLPLDQARFY